MKMVDDDGNIPTRQTCTRTCISTNKCSLFAWFHFDNKLSITFKNSTREKNKWRQTSSSCLKYGKTMENNKIRKVMAKI